MRPSRGPGDRTRLRLTGVSIALLVLAIIALITWLVSHRALELGLAVVLVMIVVLDVLAAWWALRDLTLDLRPPVDAAAGLPTTWGVSVDGWRRPFSVRPQLVAHAAEQLMDSPTPAVVTWPAMGRGVVPFVVFDVVAAGPLGLSSAGRRIVHHFVIPMHVGPVPIDAGGRTPRPKPVGFGPVEGTPIGEDLFRSIRTYRRGDERRRVHWKATAHHGELMVRELDGTGTVLVRIVVDLGPSGPSAEHTASVAASVAEAALGRGWQVELVTLDAGIGRTLVSTGRVFGAPPVMQFLPPGHLATVVAPVRSVGDVRRRLASAAAGSMSMPAAGPGNRRSCSISPAGVVWA